MALTRNPLSLPAPSVEFLLGELDALARSSPHAHRRRTGRVAVTFRPCRQGRDAITDRPIPFDAFRLLAISYSWSNGGGRCPRRRVVLGVYKATLDLRGTGRIRFRCEQSHDLTAPRTLTRPRPNFTAIRSGVLLHQAVEDAEPAEFASGLRWPRFYYGFEPGRTPDFDPGEFPEAESAGLVIDGMRAWPAEWFARQGGRLFREWTPTRVFASLAHLKGRIARNPAFAVLKRHGLVRRGLGYREWLVSVGRLAGRGQIFQDPGDERTEAGLLRRSIEGYVVGDPAREASLLADLEAGCIAMGVRVGEGADRLDALAELLDNPWCRPTVPYAAAIQLLKPAGSSDAGSMSFSDGASDIDLADPGPDRDPLQGALAAT